MILSLKPYSKFTSIEFVFAVAGELDVRIPLAGHTVEGVQAENPSQ